MLPKRIRQEAERLGAHLVCIGSHGRSGLAKAVLGSVAQSVVAQSQRPVLIVRQATTMTARGIIKLVVPPCRTVDEGSRIQARQ